MANRHRIHPQHQQSKLPYISDAASLAMGMWNCGGLSKVKKDIVTNCDFDLTCLTETHEWRDSDPLTIYSEKPPKTIHGQV